MPMDDERWTPDRGPAATAPEHNPLISVFGRPYPAALTAELLGLHAVCRAAWTDKPLPIRDAFTHIAIVPSQVPYQHIWAVIHAAEHGYALCYRSPAGQGIDRRCWLPQGHTLTDCTADWSLWRYLYGDYDAPRKAN